MRYDELEKMYRLEDVYWWFVGRRRLVRELVRKYGVDRPRMLDVGCGTGGTLDAVASLGHVSGADAAQEALEFCRRRGHASLVRCLAQDLAFAQGGFDVVLGCDLLEHVDDDAAAAGELARVLRPAGVVVLTVPAYQWLWSEHDEALSHRRRYSRRQLRELLEAAGLQPLKLTSAVSFVFPGVLLVRLLRRLRLKGTGLPHTLLMSVPPWANRLLVWLHDVETWIVCRWGFPFGTSIVAVAQKPREAS